MDCVKDKPHVVFLPEDKQGHMNPFLQLAKLFYSYGFHITFVLHHDSIVLNQGPDSAICLPDFQFETILARSSSSDPMDSETPNFMNDYIHKRQRLVDPFRKLLQKLNLCHDVPPVTCVISDADFEFAAKVAREVSIPHIHFWPCSAATVMGIFQCKELIRRGIVPFKDESFGTDGSLDEIMEWVPGMKNVRLRDFPSFIRTTDHNYITQAFGDKGLNTPMDKSDIILLNTFDELEQEVLTALKASYPNIYSIGPLPLLIKDAPIDQIKTLKRNLWKEDLTCIDWLDKQKPSSVVYVSYGSVADISGEELTEVLWGLAESKQPFLCILRPEIMENCKTLLTGEFQKEIENRGMLTTWCPQYQVLSHSSIACFLTHCGWNSTLESVCKGVPLLCWPFFGDQPMNCRYACNEWGIGIEISKNVKRHQVVQRVNEMIAQGQKSTEIRMKSFYWKNKAQEAADVEGSSFNNFQRLVQHILHYSK